MSSILIPNGSYFFWGYEASFGGGIQGEHLPFNKILSITIPDVEYTTVVSHSASSLKHTTETTAHLVTPEMEIESEFNSPFVLLNATQYNTITAAWTGTGDAITGNFSATTHRTSIWVQVHLENQDGSNDEDLTFKGGFITEYHFVIEEGQPIKERFKIQFQTVAAATQAPDIDAGLDDGEFDTTGVDGGYANWDGTENQTIPSSNCTVTWNNAALAGIHWTKIDLPIMIPRNYAQDGSSTAPVFATDKERPQPEISVEGYWKGDQDTSEVLATYESKTKATFKIQYGTTKYLQYTNTYKAKRSSYNQKAEKGTLLFKGGASYVFSYSWTANEATNPSDYINHADP